VDEGCACPDAGRTLRTEVVWTDNERNSVCAYAVYSGTHTGEGGPVPPTGKSTSTDYVYVMEFEDDKIRHTTKIGNAGLALKDLGWA
jgi:predicted ester cyclase